MARPISLFRLPAIVRMYALESATYLSKSQHIWWRIRLLFSLDYHANPIVQARTYPFFSGTKPNNALLLIPCFGTITNKAYLPLYLLLFKLILYYSFPFTHIRYFHSYTTQMHAVYNKFKHRIFPSASPPRPLSNVWDLRATNYFTTAFSGTGMTPLLASQLSMQFPEVDAQVLRAQSVAAKAQKQTVTHDKRVWREEYLRSKKGNVLRKRRNESGGQRDGDRKSANKLRKSGGKGSVFMF